MHVKKGFNTVKKLNSKNNKFSLLELNKQDDTTRYSEEQWKSLVAVGPMPKEGSDSLDIGSYCSHRKIMTSIRALFGYGIGRDIVKGEYHFWENDNDQDEQISGSLCVVNRLGVPEINAAASLNSRFVDLEIPDHGTIVCKLPTKTNAEGKKIAYCVSPWMAVRLTGYKTGELFNTDQNIKYETNVANYHNVIEALDKGNKVNIMVTMSHNPNTFELYRDAHDLADRVFHILTDKDFDPAKARADQLAEKIAQKDVKSDKFSGSVQEFNLNRSNTEIETVTTIAVLNGAEMNLIDIPTGVYKLADAKGKAFGADYAVRSVADRLGLQRKTEPTTGKVFLVTVR